MQGILDRLGYLQGLGGTALYLNPLNASPSLHTYDAQEDLLRPETWTFTSAGRLVLDLIRAAHARGMRVVLDYSWNHSGLTHPAFQSVLRDGRSSPYADWYRIDCWDDPATPDTSEFAYTSWAGVPDLPEWRKTNVIPNPAALFWFGASCGPV